jgi:hypothetical protein
VFAAGLTEGEASACAALSKLTFCLSLLGREIGWARDGCFSRVVLDVGAQARSPRGGGERKGEGRVSVDAKPAAGQPRFSVRSKCDAGRHG